MDTKRMLARGLVGMTSLLLWQAAAAGAPAPPPAGPAPAPPAATRPGSTAPEGAATEAAPKAGSANGTAEEPPPDAVAAPPEGDFYRRIDLEVTGLLWMEPGQRGLIEAHPLVMGLAAMALATVALLFFFLRGIKRPKGEDL